MHDDCSGRCLNDADLVKRTAHAAADHQREALVELENANRVGISVQHVLVADSIFTGAGRDDRAGGDDDKLACHMAARKLCGSRTQTNGVRVAPLLPEPLANDGTMPRSSLGSSPEQARKIHYGFHNTCSITSAMTGTSALDG